MGFVESNGVKCKEELLSQRNATDFKDKLLHTYIESIDLPSYPESLQKKVQRLDKYIKKLPAKRAKVDALKMSSGAVLSFYGNLSKKAMRSIVEVAHISDDNYLTRSLTSYYYFLQVKEEATLERDLLMSVFMKNNFTPAGYKKFLAIIARQESYLDAFRSVATPDIIALYNQERKDPSFGEVTSIQGTVFEMHASGAFDMNPDDWFAVSSQKIKVYKDLEEAIAKDIQVYITNLIEKANHLLWMEMIVTLLLNIGLLALAFMTMRSINRKIIELQTTIMEVANSKNLNTHVDISGTDEMSVISSAFSNLMGETKKVILSAQEGTAQNQKVAEEMDKVFEAVVKNMKNETEIVEKTSHEVHELQSTLQYSAQNAKEAQESIVDAGNDLENARQKMLSMIDTMHMNAENAVHNVMNITTKSVEESSNSITQSAQKMELFLHTMQEIKSMSEQNSHSITGANETTNRLKSIAQGLKKSLDAFIA